MPENATPAVEGRALRDALAEIHGEISAMAKAPDLDPALVQAATEAISTLRMSAAFCADNSEALTGRLREIRETLCDLLDDEGNSMKHRALLRAAAFVSGAICELKPSIL